MVFLLISVVIFVLIALFVPKRLTKNELYAICLFSIVLGFTVDIVLYLKYHFYGYFEPGVQFLGFLPALFLFPTSGIVFMNFTHLINLVFIRVFTFFAGQSFV